MTDHSPHNPDDAAQSRDDAELREFLGAFELPQISAGFTDDTCRKIELQRQLLAHDPAASAPATSGDFADRVVHAVLDDRAVSSASDSLPGPGSARAPTDVELRSNLVPYLLVAVLLVATAVALIWPKGPGDTMPKIQTVAGQLDQRVMTASDPVSVIGGLVPVGDFATAAPAFGQEVFEIPRFAPPTLHDFEAADFEARAIEVSTR